MEEISNMSKTPKVYISDMTFDESRYVRGKYRWKASDLYEYAKKQGLKPFDLPLAGVNLLGTRMFSLENLDDFIFQCKRVMNCDTNIPIILDDYGQIADGYHRVCRAIIEGKTHIKAYRLNRMPTNYEIVKDE